MPSPVPKPDARRKRHEIAAQQSSTRLPVTGRVGRPPTPPVTLGTAGKRWWRWAWTTPQAVQWHKGYMEPLGRRAQLEDEYERAGDSETSVAARARLLPMMLRVDEAFGLTPQAAAKQHLVFVDEPLPPKDAGNGSDPKVTPIRPRLRGMRE